MTEEISTPEAVPADAEGDKGTDSQSGGLSLEDLNKTLGKDFKDEATALKALKETQDFVGDKGQKLTEAEAKLAEAEKASEQSKTQAERLEALEKNDKLNQFYKENPEMDNPSTKRLLEKFGDPYEAIKNEDFKSINDPILAHNKSEQGRSIIHKSSRLGQVTNKVDESKQALDEALNKSSVGDQVGARQAYDKASNQAVNAVLDAIEKPLRK